MNCDYGIVYKCAVQGRTAFLLKHLYYSICLYRSSSHKAHKTKYLLTNIRLLKRFLFIEKYSKNSYCGGLLQGQVRRKGKMKLNEIIFTLSMGGMLLVLTMMVLGFGL